VRGLIIALALSAICCLPEPARAAERFEPGQCMTLHNEREDGPIKDMAVQIDRADRADFIHISFTEWDVPNILFDTRAICSDKGDQLFCNIDCDGGSVTVSAASNDTWKLDAQHLNYAMIGPESLFAADAPDAGSLTGSFSVKKAEGDKLCRAAPDIVFVAIEPGDISPRVQRAERLLNRLGHLLEFPDTVYDEATAEAVRRFQRQYDLMETGSIDQATSDALSSVGFAGGGC
jgi:hypothetical protein